jgi:hypothetical protein
MHRFHNSKFVSEATYKKPPMADKRNITIKTLTSNKPVFSTRIESLTSEGSITVESNFDMKKRPENKK